MNNVVINSLVVALEMAFASRTHQMEADDMDENFPFINAEELEVKLQPIVK